MNIIIVMWIYRLKSCRMQSSSSSLARTSSFDWMLASFLIAVAVTVLYGDGLRCSQGRVRVCALRPGVVAYQGFGRPIKMAAQILSHIRQFTIILPIIHNYHSNFCAERVDYKTSLNIVITYHCCYKRSRLHEWHCLILLRLPVPQHVTRSPRLWHHRVHRRLDRRSCWRSVPVLRVTESTCIWRTYPLTWSTWSTTSGTGPGHLNSSLEVWIVRGCWVNLS